MAKETILQQLQKWAFQAADNVNADKSITIKLLLGAVERGGLSESEKKFLSDNGYGNVDALNGVIKGQTKKYKDYLKNPSAHIEDTVKQIFGDKSSGDLTDQELQDKLDLLNAYREEGRGQAVGGTITEDVSPGGTTLIDLPLSGVRFDPADTEKYDAEINSIKEILSGRKFQAEKNAAEEDYLSQLPSYLQETRDEQLGALEEQALNEYGEYVPRAMGSLNAQGLLFSGDVEDELSTRALNISSELDAIALQTEAEDNEFYYQAAYNRAFKKNMESRRDYDLAIAEERGKVITERENRFKSNQSDLNRVLEEQLKRDDAERNLRLKEASLRTNRDASKNSRRGQLFSNLVQSGLSVAGTYAGSKAAGAPSVKTPESIG